MTTRTRNRLSRFGRSATLLPSGPGCPAAHGALGPGCGGYGAEVSTGYSGTPLVRKLGIRPGDRVLLDGAPNGLVLPDVLADDRIRRREYDVAVLFCPDQARLAVRWPALHRRLTPAGALWVGWPKRASGVRTDLTEDAVRAFALANGRVDVKVCAVDETWSALKCVIRLVDR